MKLKEIETVQDLNDEELLYSRIDPHKALGWAYSRTSQNSNFTEKTIDKVRKNQKDNITTDEVINSKDMMWDISLENKDHVTNTMVAMDQIRIHEEKATVEEERRKKEQHPQQ